MDELIVLLIKLIIKAFDKGGQGSRQEQMRRGWEKQQAWERQQRELQERQGQGAGGQPVGRAVRLPPAVPLPTAATPIPRRKVPKPKRLAPPPLPGVQGTRAVLTSDLSGEPAARVAPPAAARMVRPGTLRQQFILSEVLKPPVALRPPAG